MLAENSQKSRVADFSRYLNQNRQGTQDGKEEKKKKLGLGEAAVKIWILCCSLPPPNTKFPNFLCLFTPFRSSTEQLLQRLRMLVVPANLARPRGHNTLNESSSLSFSQSLCLSLPKAWLNKTYNAAHGWVILSTIYRKQNIMDYQGRHFLVVKG